MGCRTALKRSVGALFSVLASVGQLAACAPQTVVVKETIQVENVDPEPTAGAIWIVSAAGR